jgi:hypothetical protein
MVKKGFVIVCYYYLLLKCYRVAKLFVIQAVLLIFASTSMHNYLKYITLYRAMLIAFILPGIFLMAMGGQPRKFFAIAYMALAGLTFLVEVLLFAFQFSRKENFWAELLLLVLLVTGGVVLV